MAVILSLTLVPAFGTGTSAGTAATADALRNVILFAPLGLLLGLGGRSLWQAAVVGALLSLSVEIAQFWIPGRYPALRDVAMDALGAAAGGGLAHALLGPIFRSATRSAWAALAVGALAAIVVVLPGFLLQPAPPQSRYFTALRPDYPRYSVFAGTVHEASIGDLQIKTETPSLQSAELRVRLREGAAITIHAEFERRLPDIAPLVRINDGSWEVLLVGTLGEDLVVRRHALAADLGLEEPLFRLPNALPSSMRGPFDIELVPDGVGWLVSIDGAAPRRVGPTPAAARRLIADSDNFSMPRAQALDALSLALMFGVCSIFVRARIAAVVGLSLPLAAMALGPRLTGLVPSPTSEWAGVAVGLFVGFLIQFWMRRAATNLASPRVAQGSRP
jgi:hypothetical protein